MNRELTDGQALLLTGGCAFFVIGAVVVEAVTGAAANSPVPAWAEELAPIAWPQAARVGWWLAVAVAAAGFQLGLRRLGIRRNPIVVAASVAPFVVFAGGIAIGADWATWH